MFITVVGAVLLVAGTWAAFRLAPRGQGAPGAGWFPDPSSTAARQRRWDGSTWADEVVDGGAPADRGRRFRGRFWGRWVGWVAASAVVLLAGTTVYRSTGQVHVLAATSLVGMALFGWAFYRFVNRQLALDDVVRPVQLVAVAAASAGATLLVAANVNAWIIAGPGIRTATATVGLVEEGTKLLVPLALLALGCYRDPRAGIGLGLASGIGFAVAETTQYAYTLPTATAPSFCGGVSVSPDAGSVVAAQVQRVFLVSPLHWLWTGIACAIAWRLWHLRGRRGTLGAVAGFALVAVVHSLNDSSITAFCGHPTAAGAVGVLKYALLPAMYLVFRARARTSEPPQLIARTSRGWTPRHLPARTVAATIPAGSGTPAGTGKGTALAV